MDIAIKQTRPTNWWLNFSGVKTSVVVVDVPRGGGKTKKIYRAPFTTKKQRRGLQTVLCEGEEVQAVVAMCIATKTKT